MNIGVDENFHHVQMRWSGNTLHMTRGDEFVAEVKGVVSLTEERRWMDASEQDILFLRLFTEDGGQRAFFIDSDPVQTNVREVSSELERLDEVFPWLLPSDYTHRQGDVGIYQRATLPSSAALIDREEYPERFIHILSKRHALDPVADCDFFVGDGRYHVRVNRQSRLVHPEHPAIALSPGIYELIGARGTPLPEFVGLREGESQELGE
jgi:hypothetical protein